MRDYFYSGCFLDSLHTSDADKVRTIVVSTMIIEIVPANL